MLGELLDEQQARDAGALVPGGLMSGSCRSAW